MEKDRKYLNCKYLDSGEDMLCSKHSYKTCTAFLGDKCPIISEEEGQVKQYTKEEAIALMDKLKEIVSCADSVNVQNEDLATFNRDIDSVRNYIISLEKEVMNLRTREEQLRRSISILYKDRTEIERKALEEAFSELITYAKAEYLMGLPNPRKGSLPTGMIKLLAERRGVIL